MTTYLRYKYYFDFIDLERLKIFDYKNIPQLNDLCPENNKNKLIIKYKIKKFFYYYYYYCKY